MSQHIQDLREVRKRVEMGMATAADARMLDSAFNIAVFALQQSGTDASRDAIAALERLGLDIPEVDHAA